MPGGGVTPEAAEGGPTSWVHSEARLHWCTGARQGKLGHVMLYGTTACSVLPLALYSCCTGSIVSCQLPKTVR